ncbi:DoxX family protein [Dyadobacter sp. CY323]|uniref:DoxX family protein n=1 Tax=Dyadobacter sp. CY323 TaxID=2907302 RepID=UPI001F31B69E|nr:DoxX family protein [Dyadobacter sp. CY323]MCE6990117.1 DoxX family protein [Dyadobacter sp. CY323]
MKKTKIIYWILTGLLAAMLGIGSVFDAMSAPEAVEHITRIGYPEYLVPFLGVMKILGIIAILVPGYPRIKEWAYAGLTYDVFGALYSHLAFGDGVQMWGGLIVGLVLIAASYFYYHKKESEVVFAA